MIKMSYFKRELPIIVLAFCGFLMIVSYFFTFDLPKTTAVTVQSWGTIVAAFALGLGVVNVLMLHIRRFWKRQGQWYLSLWAVFAYFSYTIWGIVYGTGDPSLNWINVNVLSVLYMSMTATTGFFVTSASFRAFTFRTWESTLMLGSGLLVLIRNIPLTEVTVPWAKVPGQWVFDIALTAGLRGIEIGLAIGVISLGIRNLLGYDRTLIGASPGEKEAA